jgi:hypothetical protein
LADLFAGSPYVAQAHGVVRRWPNPFAKSNVKATFFIGVPAKRVRKYSVHPLGASTSKPQFDGTSARTGTPRLSSISETCRPVLPWRPPAAEVTRTGFVMADTPGFAGFAVDTGDGTNRYHMIWSMVPNGTKSRHGDGHEKVS